MGQFADQIIAWQQVHGRHDLPWQHTREAYRVWLSEIMLQQTQVATVIPYYQRFVGRFPDVNVLAEAPIEDVMSHWAGLGYYSRARNLHECARRVVRDHGGAFPSDVDALASLPGIGRSTAGAIAALAFGQRAAILEGNVKRVLARHFGLLGYPGTPSVERDLWQRANALLPVGQIGTYTQGLMDLGATLCTRARPKCGVCPLAETCVALREQMTGVLPTPRPVKQRPTRTAIVLVLRDQSGSVLLEQRPSVGIWGGLLSLLEFDASASAAEIAAAVHRRYGLRIAVHESLGEVRHQFTHFSYVMHPRLARCAGAAGASS
ncbi:MAG TPA: A/G-specific adenine glycosylase, partial [Burkholderiaceae bacterium]|nr:A/G-specific adenine glycosylase [Burkholderiaceae bacterium]